MRIKMKANVRVYEDTDTRNALFAFDDTRIEEVYDGFERYASGRFSIASGATETLSLGDVGTVRGIFIKADGDFNLTLNGATPALQIRRAGTTSDFTAKALLDVNLTSASVENAISPAATLTGYFVVWGAPSS